MGEGNVVDLDRKRSASIIRSARYPVAGVVNCLEELLEKARSGEIRSIAFVTVTGPANIGQGWAESDGWYHEITSGLATLQFRWMQDNSGYGG